MTTPPPNPLSAAIQAFLLDRFLFSDDPADLPDDLLLVEAGILDSMGALELIEFLEERFGIAIGNDEIERTTFESVAAITRFVAAKIAAAGATPG